MIAPVVSPEWLREHRDEVVLADVRWYLDGRSGRDAYERGHLPGAVFVDLDTVLAAPPSPAEGRHPLPSPSAFAAGLGAVGIGDGTTVVAYDDAGGVVAARLVWLLRAIGHEAALLDGGPAGPLSPEAPDVTAATFTPVPWPSDRLASIDDAASPDSVVLDAREPERFTGVHEPVDPRPGHIPGARNLPTRDHLGPDGRLLGPDALRARFAGAGVTADSDVVSYCGSGVNACHALLALEVAGLGPGRLYPGSWSQWSHTDRPAAVGDA